MAIKQCANTAMADHEDITALPLADYCFGFGDDSRLSINGAFPAAKAFAWVSEKLIGGMFEFFAFEIASGAAVVLVSMGADGDFDVQRVGNQRCSFDRLGLAAGDNQLGVF